MQKKIVLVFLILVGVSGPARSEDQESAAIILFNGELNTTPDQQGWAYLTNPIGTAQATQVAADGRTVLDSTPETNDQAGYFSNFPPVPAHPAMPPRLDRTQGFSVAFEAQLIQEIHESQDRAGFSVIALSHDGMGIELGFWESEIWAQSDTFTHAESNATMPFDPTAELTAYELFISENEYRLAANETEILSGPLRDYSAQGPPYTLTDFLFLGDDTSSASAEAGIASVSVSVPGAQSVTYTLDPERSEISVVGTVLGDNALQEQGPGSLSTLYEGAIQATLLDGSIRFPGGSVVDARTSGEWQPDVGATEGAAPADYGAQASVLFQPVNAAARHLVLDLESGFLPIANGEFSADEISASFPEDSESLLEYRVGGIFPTAGSETLNGIRTINQTSSQATLEQDGAVETLTIPVEAIFLLELLSPDDTTLSFQGQLVATRAIQPPFEIASIELLEDQKLKLTWNAEPGKSYNVSSSSDLETWGVLEENLTTSETTLSWTNVIQSNFEFYRIEE